MTKIRCLFKSETMREAVKDLCEDYCWPQGIQLLEDSFNVVNFINNASLEKHKVVVMCETEEHYKELERLGVCDHFGVVEELPTVQTLIKILNDDKTTGVAIFIGCSNIEFSIEGIDDIVYIGSDDYHMRATNANLLGKDNSTTVYCIDNELSVMDFNRQVDFDYVEDFINEFDKLVNFDEAEDFLEEVIEETPFVEETVHFEEELDSPGFIHADFPKKKIGWKKKKKLKKNNRI